MIRKLDSRLGLESRHSMPCGTWMSLATMVNVHSYSKSSGGGRNRCIDDFSQGGHGHNGGHIEVQFLHPKKEDDKTEETGRGEGAARCT